MDAKQLDQCLKYFDRVEKRYDRLCEKFDRYEDIGDHEEQGRLEPKMNMLLSEMDGIRKTLSYLGYVIKYQVDKNVIVERRIG